MEHPDQSLTPRHLGCSGRTANPFLPDGIGLGRIWHHEFLRGWTSKPGRIHATFLAEHGQPVYTKVLPDEDFEKALGISRPKHLWPDLIVGLLAGRR